MKSRAKKEKLNAHCLICGRFFFGEAHERCPVCNGMCQNFPDSGLHAFESNRDNRPAGLPGELHRLRDYGYYFF